MVGYKREHLLALAGSDSFNVFSPCFYAHYIIARPAAPHSASGRTSINLHKTLWPNLDLLRALVVHFAC